ncbi:cytochrome P450 [Streptomyces sp. NPDC002018]|uniref:cytochrome P450 n=1 Tax=Streptomyces sp. NPDC002018 TaxID=3364629 RepID=UPI0036A8FA9D
MSHPPHRAERDAHKDGDHVELGECPAVSYPMQRQDPFHPPAEYEALRAQGPVVPARLSFAGDRPAWLVTRFKEAREVLADTRFSSDSRLPGFPVRRAHSTLIRMDPPDHTRYRDMINHEFVGRRVAELRPVIEDLTDRLLDDIARGPARSDLLPALAMPLPSLVICHLLGVSYADHVFLQERTADALRATSTAEEIDEAVADLGRYMDRVVQSKLDTPGDDIISRLVTDHVRTGACTPEVAADLARLLLVAGHVTTVNMIGLGILTLLQHPEQLDELRHNERLTGPAVNELLRHLTITPSLARVATQDVEVGGTLIRAGEGVMILLSSANRDEREFHDPATFDIHRKERVNLALGWGPHLCLGAALARLELQIVITRTLRRFPGLRLAVDLDTIPFRHKVNIYGVHELPVVWDE